MWWATLHTPLVVVCIKMMVVLGLQTCTLGAGFAVREPAPQA
jgi:hypothetical protein